MSACKVTPGAFQSGQVCVTRLAACSRACVFPSISSSLLFLFCHSRSPPAPADQLNPQLFCSSSGTQRPNPNGSNQTHCVRMELCASHQSPPPGAPHAISGLTNRTFFLLPSPPAERTGDTSEISFALCSSAAWAWDKRCTFRAHQGVTFAATCRKQQLPMQLFSSDASCGSSERSRTVPF